MNIDTFVNQVLRKHYECEKKLGVEPQLIIYIDGISLYSLEKQINLYNSPNINIEENKFFGHQIIQVTGEKEHFEIYEKNKE